MNKKLQPYRTEIDAIDDKILDLLARRFEIIRAVGHLKTAENITIVQTARAEEVMQRVTTIAQNKNIPTLLIHDFYKNMIEEAHKTEFGIQEETENGATGNKQEASQAESLYGKENNTSRPVRPYGNKKTSQAESLHGKEQEARKGVALTGNINSTGKHHA